MTHGREVGESTARPTPSSATGVRMSRPETLAMRSYINTPPAGGTLIVYRCANCVFFAERTVAVDSGHGGESLRTARSRSSC